MATMVEGTNGRDDVHVPTTATTTPEHTALLGLRHDELEQLLEAGSTQHAHRHHVVFCEGELLSNLYLVQSGSFKLIRHSEEGKELIVGLLGPGDAFGALAAPVESQTLAQALEDTAYVLVPLVAIRRVMSHNAELAVALLKLATEHRQRVEVAAARLAFESVARRLAQLILDHSDPSSGDMRFPLNQTELANSIGSSRETVCSVLSQFRRRGLVAMRRGQVRVLDRSELGRVR